MHVTAELHEVARQAARAGVAAAFVAAWDRSHLAPALRSTDPDADAWVARQMAKRAAYIARLAAQLGIDPAEAARTWGSRSLGAPTPPLPRY